MERVVVGMSGGVDSSVAAALLKEAGHEVIGVTLHLWDYQRDDHAGRCCAPEDQYDARRVCDVLEIPHYTFDRRELFRARVVEPFVRDYTEGRTPSPCVQCNEHVKFGPLATIARRLGATRIATGHYARLLRDGDRVRLLRGRDHQRDQSYFLFAVLSEALDMLELPLGDMTKDEVRAHAARFGLRNADKPDSTDLCFVEGRDYAEWVEAHGGRAKDTAGRIVTVDGRVLGEHNGLHHFTVGQRRGVPGVDGVARYVLRVVNGTNDVVVGDAREATARTVRIERTRWLGEAPETATVKLRYRHAGVRTRVVTGNDSSAELELDEPQRGAAPGQAAVLYEGDEVLGGGWIA